MPKIQRYSAAPALQLRRKGYQNGEIPRKTLIGLASGFSLDVGRQRGCLP
jgi:hypothetical protein